MNRGLIYSRQVKSLNGLADINRQTVFIKEKVGKPSETDSIKFKISSKTSRGKNRILRFSVIHSYFEGRVILIGSHGCAFWSVRP